MSCLPDTPRPEIDDLVAVVDCLLPDARLLAPTLVEGRLLIHPRAYEERLPVVALVHLPLVLQIRRHLLVVVSGARGQGTIMFNGVLYSNRVRKSR